MTFRGWDRINIAVDSKPACMRQDRVTGEPMTVEAIAPVIISASRATDIPAFYAGWFVESLKKGYIRWINPYNHRCQYVSFAKTRVIVFWSKYPLNLIQHLPELDRRGINYYIHFTLNNYEKEGIEPGLPPIEARIGTFIRLSSIIGRDRIIWRFDPLLLSDTITVDTLVLRIMEIGSRIHKYTRTLVFSFVDIAEYKSVPSSLQQSGFTGAREFSIDEKRLFAEKLQKLNEDWKLDIFTCAEEIDLTEFGIRKGSCIDYDLMARIFSQDRELMGFLHPTVQTNLSGVRNPEEARMMKDPGQRRECGCFPSKDIGQYNTCMHLCTYCYANKSVSTVKKNYEKHLRQIETGKFPESIIPGK